jgi:formylglycine-generating enzyme required for sulfatase activity
VAASPRPGQVAGLSLADLEREESTRKEWTAWQAKMKADFDRTAQFSGGPDLQVKAWERFLLAWAQDNPQSQEDEGLRELAQSRLAGVRQAALQPARPVAQTISVTSGKKIKDCADCPEMVMIPAGSFEMGSAEHKSEQSVHRVNLPSFLLGRTEVTQGQWLAVMGSNPSDFKQCGADCPVENISWNDAQEFARKLSAKTGKNYRLPSESEWEYAARAGSSSKWSFGDDESQLGAHAWFRTNSGANTHPVAQKRPNPFGLFDMHGNAWEWVQDTWHENYQGAPADGSAWVSGGDQARRVLHGGAWNNYPGDLRSAIRDHRAPVFRSNSTGLRIARTL